MDFFLMFTPAFMFFQSGLRCCLKQFEQYGTDMKQNKSNFELERLNISQALNLWQEADLFSLGKSAHSARIKCIQSK